MSLLRREDPRGVDVNGFNRKRQLAIAFYMGCAAAIIQVLLIRELLSLCRGNELIIGMILASWFIGIYLGARFNAQTGREPLERRVLASLLVLPILAAISIYSAHAVQVIVPRTVGTFYSISAELAFAILFTAPVSFFVGYFFPPLVSLLAADMNERSGGVVFYVESLGSFAGGIAFSFVLVELLNPLALLCALGAGSCIIVCWDTNKKLLPLAVLPLALIFFSGMIEKQIFTTIWNRTHTGKLVHYQRTKYQTVSVESSQDTVSVYGDGMLIYTLPDKFESRGLFHLIQSLRQGRASMLLMGSGPGSLLHNLAATDIERLYYFDADPQLWDAVHPYIRQLYPEPERKKKFFLYKEDLRHFLLNTNKRFDMIVCIAPPPENIMLNRFYTREFYALCKSRLTDTGIMIASLHGFSNYLSADMRQYIASLYRGFTRSFGDHLMTSGESMFLIGAKKPGVLPSSVDELIARYGRELKIKNNQLEKEITNNYSPDELRMFFETSQLRYFEQAMQPLVNTVEANQDLKPGAYWKNIILAAFREQSFIHAVIRGFIALPLLALIFTGAVLWDAGRKYGRAARARAFLIYATGLASMSTMLVMILLYQNSHGMVYYRISLINALFMLGLAMGSFTFSNKRIFGLAGIFFSMTVSMGVILVYIWTGFATLFWALLFIFSCLCGAVFPSLFAGASGNDYLATASMLDAMDHFGAIAGSLLTVMFFLPLLGISGTLFVNMGLAALAGVMGFWMALK